MQPSHRLLPTCEGHAWILGDNIDTGQIAPGHAMRKPLEVLATHCLESILPEFSRDVRRGDIIVAGEGFGIGSSREQAPQALRYLGVSVVLARSFGRIFYRNALNLGLPALVYQDTRMISPGDALAVDLSIGTVENRSRGYTGQAQPMPEFLLDLIAHGGLIPHLHARFSRSEKRHG